MCIARAKGKNLYDRKDLSADTRNRYAELHNATITYILFYFATA